MPSVVRTTTTHQRNPSEVNTSLHMVPPELGPVPRHTMIFKTASTANTKQRRQMFGSGSKLARAQVGTGFWKQWRPTRVAPNVLPVGVHWDVATRSAGRKCNKSSEHACGTAQASAANVRKCKQVGASASSTAEATRTSFVGRRTLHLL